MVWLFVVKISKIWVAPVLIAKPMKKLIYLFFSLGLCVNLSAQKQAVGYSGGTSSYVGMGYIYYGTNFGIGVDLAGNIGTIETFPQGDRYEMNENEILDNGEHDWSYADIQSYDRGFLTFRLYGRLSGDEWTGEWLYAGIGPGWSRNYYGYDWSGGTNTEYVMNRGNSFFGTEIQAGYMYQLQEIFLLVGYSGIDFIEKPQVTFGFMIGF